MSCAHLLCVLIKQLSYFFQCIAFWDTQHELFDNLCIREAAFGTFMNFIFVNAIMKPYSFDAPSCASRAFIAQTTETNTCIILPSFTLKQSKVHVQHVVHSFSNCTVVAFTVISCLMLFVDKWIYIHPSTCNAIF